MTVKASTGSSKILFIKQGRQTEKRKTGRGGGWGWEDEGLRKQRKECGERER